MALINSTTNQQIKYLRSLGNSRRERHRERRFVLEGVRLVAAALDAGVHLPLVVYAPAQLARSEGGSALLARLATLPGSYAATERAIAAAADTVTPQGVVAAADWPTPPRTGSLLLVLDALQDPGNVGALLRSAEAAGGGAVLSSLGTADLYSPKVVRAAMGAHCYLPLLPDLCWHTLVGKLATLRAGGGAVYAATAGATQPYYAVDWRTPAALIIGSEAHGVSAEALQQTTRQITIPMAGQAESLNAAVAGSVILFEALRQRNTSTHMDKTAKRGREEL